jgi:hypothetical protein
MSLLRGSASLRESIFVCCFFRTPGKDVFLMPHDGASSQNRLPAVTLTLAESQRFHRQMVFANTYNRWPLP